MSVDARLEKLLRSGQAHLLRGGLKGLEKESLRLSREGLIAQTPHPAALGSALTHPWITTDYSEALIELITPPFDRAEEAIGFLSDVHAFVYQHLEDEVLLATSMPVGLNGDESIPIARYGHSNIGMMKQVYRRGLAYRYGRTMQSIAGVHFNYSVNEALWPVLQDLEGDTRATDCYIADAYFGTIRNVHRYGWLLIYLFGNSPALCRSFFRGREELAARFAGLGKDTLYRPHATSLRMSDIGYRNDNQTCLDISFNGLQEYIASLSEAIKQPFPPYERIGVKVNGEYRQLNANILQIENEYYSLIRPKQITHSGEMPTLALKKRGVRYLELRALDLLSFDPAGISLDEIRFLEVFVLFCLLADSPPLTAEEKAACNLNNLSVACCGRGPEFQLLLDESEIGPAVWAQTILDGLLPIADILDEGESAQPYRTSVERQRSAVTDPAQTLSARILRELQSEGESFAEFALRLSGQHARHWLNFKLAPERAAEFAEDAERSWRSQTMIEANDTVSFDEFLGQYWDQS